MAGLPPPAEAAAPGPTAADIEAAAEAMPPEERQAMIEGMVDAAGGAAGGARAVRPRTGRG